MGRKKNDDNDGYFVCVHLDKYYLFVGDSSVRYRVMGQRNEIVAVSKK